MLPTSPVLITGVIPEEPALTRVVTAGSGVSCGCVVRGADACRVTLRDAIGDLDRAISPPATPFAGLKAVAAPICCSVGSL